MHQQQAELSKIGDFSISLSDSLAFSRLSGDYNPLHIDAVSARRTQYGGTVTHGVHLILRALAELGARGVFDGLQPTTLSVKFDRPIPTGSSVTLFASRDHQRIRLTGKISEQPAFSASIDLTSVCRGPACLENAEFAVSAPEDISFPPNKREGSTPLKLSHALMASLFPSLNVANGNWIADLLATTRVVGMCCPGRHSIFSSFKLQRVLSSANRSSLTYSVSTVEPRFQLLRMRVVGAYFEGVLEAAFRARPVVQRTCKEVAKLVCPNAFAGDRVLVVGGSRGLGELVAKIAAAGGAELTITYNLGEADAARVRSELHELRLSCTVRRLNVLNASSEDSSGWLSASAFSHLYFFASPPVSKNLGPWSEPLFQRFSQVYVTALATLVEQVACREEHRPIRVLYPSSVFVSQPARGFAEYAVAKSAGESLCDQLQCTYKLRVMKPRLPRMLTDQTSGLTNAETTDALPTMLEVVQRLHST